MNEFFVKTIEPSPSFVSRVMTAVRRERALPPLAFPLWRFAAAVVVFIVTVIFGPTV